MATDYTVRFYVHIIPLFKPEGWENPQIHDAFIHAENFQELKKLANKEALMFVQQQGVVVLKDTGKPLADDIPTLDRMRFIPMNIISHIERETKTIHGKLDEDSDDLPKGQLN